MEKWNIEYSNDVGPNDEGFWEWWEVSCGEVEFKCDSKNHAEWLCNILNSLKEQTND